ncbi:hypothetical protein GPECTOR_59g670 [Gonium pectorale]|uniref:Uncharacterized protein n=1 Tax=Gonium pectorale TaxID=33097 RepID=A0A150G5F8_GONPE|nr:hypothetical protein GPECTOR_59g670 [Gonium pectorale]|eukprot:KXZ45061.1 hypothetical protein GPECTOR_59g670 [Gonium pectorale]
MIVQVLEEGVRIGGRSYHFLGHSNEQLKSRSCFLFRSESLQEVEEMLCRWADFRSIASVAKRAKRTALLFSRFRPVELPEQLRRHEEIDDICTPDGRFKYTDGCGYCSLQLATYLARRLCISHRGRRWVPSVFQIRYLGYKGVVAVQPGLDALNKDRPPEQQVHLQLRKSMCKFRAPQRSQQQQQQQKQARPQQAASPSPQDCGDGSSSSGDAAGASGGSGAAAESAPDDAARLVFGVVDYSKPYKYGFLNSQAVMLLSALGVPEEVMVRRQAAHLADLAQLLRDEEAALRYLLAVNKMEEAELLVEYGLAPAPPGELGALEAAAAAARSRVRSVLREMQREEMDKLVKVLPPLSPVPPSQPTPQPQQPQRPHQPGQLGQQGGELDDPIGDEDDGLLGELAGAFDSTCGTAPPALEGAASDAVVPESLPPPAAAEPPTDSGGPAGGAAVAGRGDADDAGGGVGARSRVSPRIRVLLEKSRRVFGVADPSLDWPSQELAAAASGSGRQKQPPQLLYGQCFFQPLVDGQPKRLVGGSVVMIRNPCYDPADVRVLDVVDCPACGHLVDVLVLPTHGPRPTADEASGGDLDGDTFLVIWDEDIVNAARRTPPVPYDAAPEVQAGRISMSHLINYFVGYCGALLGRIDRLYHLWAGVSELGPASAECRALSQLFSRGVDSVSTGAATAIPQHLQLTESSLTPEQRARLEGRVWRRMERTAEAAWRGYNEFRAMGLLADPTDPWDVRDLDARGLMRLIRGTDEALSDFELLRLLVRWCRARPDQQQRLADWALHLDFGRMTHEQRLFALAAGVPRCLVFNALEQSALLGPDDLAAYQLGGGEGLHWKLLGEGESDDPLAFDHFHTALTAFRKKLLVLQMAEPSQVIVMYINEAFPAPGTYKCGADMLVFAFAGCFRRKHELQSHNLWLDLASNRIQIYRNGNTSQSFLWLHKGPPPVAPRAPIALLAPSTEPEPNVGLAPRGPGRGRGRSGGGRGRGGGGGRGAGGGDTLTRVSIATIEVDRQAFADGQIRKVTKEPLLRYEIYVVSDRLPLQSRGVVHLRGAGLRAADEEDEASRGGAGADAGADGGGSNALPPTEEPTAPEDVAALEALRARLAVSQAARAGACTAAARLAGDLAGQGKLTAAMKAARLARPLLPEETALGLLRCAARLHAASAAGEVVGWMLEGPAGPGTGAAREAGSGAAGAGPSRTAVASFRGTIDRALRVLRVAASTGALVTCPQAVTRVWQVIREAAGSAQVAQDATASNAAGAAAATAAVGPLGGLTSPHPAPLLGERDLELLLTACIACADASRHEPEMVPDLMSEILTSVAAPPTAPTTHGSAAAAALTPRLLLRLLDAVTCSGADRESALLICGVLLNAAEAAETDAASSAWGGDDRASVAPYCRHWAAVLTYEALEETHSADVQLALRAMDEVAGLLPGSSGGGGGGGGAAAPVAAPPITLWGFIAERVDAAARARRQRERGRDGGSAGRRRPGQDERSDLEALAGREMRRLAEERWRAQMAAAARSGGSGGGAAASQAIELVDLVAAPPPASARPPPAEPYSSAVAATDDYAVAPGPPDTGASSRDSDGDGSGEGPVDEAVAAPVQGRDYDEATGALTVEGHDAFAGRRGLSADAQGLLSPDGGAEDGFSLELRNLGGLPISSGGGGGGGQSIRVGDRVRLSDARTPPHMLRTACAYSRPLSGGDGGGGGATTGTYRDPLPLWVEGVVTDVGVMTLTVQLPWQPELEVPVPVPVPATAMAPTARVPGSAAAASPGGSSAGGVDAVGGGAAAGAGSTVAAGSAQGGGGGGGVGDGVARAPRRWRLQRLGNVVTYRRGMQALLRCYDRMAAPRPAGFEGLLMSASSSATGHVAGTASAAPSTPLDIIVRSWARAPPPSVPPAGSGGGSSTAVADGCGGWAAAASARAAPAARCPPELAARACPEGSNASQRAAVVAAAEGVLSIIHGPPGTGKTTTIAGLLLALLMTGRGDSSSDPRVGPAENGATTSQSCAATTTKRHQAPILVTAETNVAVDNILARLLRLAGEGGSASASLELGGPPGDIIRVGDSAGVGEPLRRYCLEALDGARSPYGYNTRAVRKALRNARLVFATCAGAGSALLDGVDFRVVVVDEASQATEPTTLIPLTRGSRQAVLVGDHKQLGPLVLSEEARRLGADVPLFERLLRPTPVRTAPAAPAIAQAEGGDRDAASRAAPLPASGVDGGGGGGAGGTSLTGSGSGGRRAAGGGAGLGAHLLDTQYRMHPDIAAFPARQFYAGRLRNGDHTSGIALPQPLTRRVTFVDVPDDGQHGGGAERCKGQSYENRGQADEAVRLVHQLLSCNAGRLAAADIGIITPYRAMVALLQAHPGLEVATVDGFQGREKAVVLLVTVRANDRGRVGFVDEARRLNVAITRAKAALVVIGSRRTLEAAAAAATTGAEAGTAAVGPGPAAPVLARPEDGGGEAGPAVGGSRGVVRGAGGGAAGIAASGEADGAGVGVDRRLLAAWLASMGVPHEGA